MSENETISLVEINEWIKERNAALLALDLEWIRQSLAGHLTIPAASIDTHTLLMSAHKARYECLSLPDAARHESRAWLAEHGCQRMGNRPLLPVGELPKDERTQH